MAFLLLDVAVALKKFPVSLIFVRNNKGEKEVLMNGVGV